MTTARTRYAALIALLALTALLTASALVRTPASADPPTRLPTQVVDAAEVLDTAGEQRVEQAVTKLSADKDLQLWVVYVKSFDGMSPEQWARDTIGVSDLSYHDILLAVSTGDRTSYLTTAEPIDGIDQSELDEITSRSVAPALRKNRWDQAATSTSAELTDVESSSRATIIVVSVIVALVVVGGAAFLIRRRRRDDDDSSSGDLTVDQLNEQPLEVLDPWSCEVLTSTDNAVSVSADELSLAVDEHGESATLPFREALRTAESALATSFKLRQRLDDGIPETADERRAMLVQIIAMCSDADDALDSQVADFDALRDLLSDVPGRLETLTERATALDARFDVSQQNLDGLTRDYTGAVVSSVADNVDLARELKRFADDNIEQGRDIVGSPDDDQKPAAAAIRSAEASLDTATKLLDAVDDAQQNLARAQAALPALIAALEHDLAASESTDDDVTAAARAALATAADTADTDPLGAYFLVAEADNRLVQSLSDDHRDQDERRRRLVARTVESAAEQVSAAESFVDTRRGALGSVARTRLSEAARLLEMAQKAADHDPDAALDVARRAASLADQALTSAQDDVSGWRVAQSVSSPDDEAPVLTGILVDSIVRSAVPAGQWGGYSSGGRSPGSFGGSESSGRIGTGGRFARAQ